MDEIGERMAAFLGEAKAIRWFENSGRPNEKYDMVFLFMRRAMGGENNIRKSGLAVCDELFERIMRDMAWACVEKILDMTSFFTMLADIYQEGYFPCSWNGEYPSDRAVVLQQE